MVTTLITTELGQATVESDVVFGAAVSGRPAEVAGWASRNLTTVCLDLLPRTLSRAQTMDALTSQASIGAAPPGLEAQSGRLRDRSWCGLLRPRPAGWRELLRHQR